MSWTIRTTVRGSFAGLTDEQRAELLAARAELDAMTWLDEHGYGYKDLKVNTVDMSQIPLGARGRKFAG